jgi:lipopolysaccharide assembly protein A
MRFLKTLFWVVLAIGIVLFARENWVPVEIKLWSGLIAEVKLPFLLFVTFLAGFLPTYLLYRGRMWNLRRQIGRPERTAVANQPVAAAPPLPLPSTMPPPLAPAAVEGEPPAQAAAPSGPVLGRRDNGPALPA